MMDRLTKRTAANGIILTGIFTSATYDTPEEVRQLLADYEDTGLTPEDLKSALDTDAIIKLCAQALGVSADRLREMAQADKDGRIRIVGVPKGACCGTCIHFERETGTAYGECKPEKHSWVAQSRIACKAHYAPVSEAALKEQEEQK